MKPTVLGISVLLILIFQSSLYAQDFDSGLVNVDDTGVAIHGFDPVEYHLTSRAIPGDSTITYTYNGAVFYFRNIVNKKIFETLPEKYFPAFGGFCAFGLSFDEGQFSAKRGRYKVDPTNFTLYSGKLMLFYPEEEWAAKSYWIEDEDLNYNRATQFWTQIKDN